MRIFKMASINSFSIKIVLAFFFFCFIYKYRQRFAVVAKAIADELDLPAENLEIYRMWGMYLDDLSCCGQECVC